MAEPEKSATEPIPPLPEAALPAAEPAPPHGFDTLPRIEDEAPLAPALEADIVRPFAPRLAEPPAAPESSGAPAADTAPREPRFGRFAQLAAAVGGAAMIGALAGSLVTSAGGGPVAHTRELQVAVTALRADIAGLKQLTETGSRDARAHVERIVQRLDKTEKTQADAGARLARIETGLERRPATAAAATPPAPETTGSIAPPPAPPKPAIVEGWVLREVNRGMALVEGRMGFFEVGVGTPLPGLGKVEAIERRDGRMVVVTTRGLIVPAR